MKSFWKQLAVSALVRALSGVFIWLAAKGYITSGQGEAVALVAATVIVNVLQTAANWLLARWHVDLARLTEGVDRQTLAQISATVSPLTKIKEAMTPGPNPSAIAAAAEVTPKV
jgi:hypothetical protein